MEKLKEVYYSSLLLNGLNSVEVGEREKTERLLNDYSDWWTEPSNYKNASSDERTVLYTALTDGRTYSDIADIGTQIESEMKKIQGDNSNSSENKNQKTDKKVNSHKSSTKSGSFSADSSVKKEDIPATKVEPKTTFTDISDVSWAVIPIETLYEKGIVNGRSATKFAPNDFVTRAEFSKLLAMALEISSEEKNLKFTDVSEEDWCYDSINSLYNAGIVTGISDNVFGKDDNLTRAAMAAMLERALDYKELIEEADEEEIYDKFADDESIPEYAKKSVYRLRKNEIINGVGGNMFDPMGYVTRAQAAKAIYTILNLK